MGYINLIPALNVMNYKSSVHESTFEKETKSAVKRIMEEPRSSIPYSKGYMEYEEKMREYYNKQLEMYYESPTAFSLK